jgi:hypothetical protein
MKGFSFLARENEEVDMRSSKVAALVLILGATIVSPALAASECPKLAELGNWGEPTTAEINVAVGATCVFPITMHGAVSSSGILQKPLHGKVKKLDSTTYEYKAKAGYKGGDVFSIKATGQGATASGTSVITVHATVK